MVAEDWETYLQFLNEIVSMMGIYFISLTIFVYSFLIVIEIPVPEILICGLINYLINCVITL